MKTDKNFISQRRVLAVLEEQGPATLGQLAGHIGSGRSLRRTLNALMADDLVVRNSKGRYVLANDRGSSERNIPKYGDTFVGVLDRSGAHWFISPINPGVKENVYVRRPKRNDVGDLVKVKLELSRQGDLIGVIVKSIPQKNIVDGVVNACLEAYQVPRRKWSRLGIQPISTAVAEADFENRIDYRSLPLVTIDGVTARDFDDAVYAESISEGGWRLVVAIADVAHYVERNGAIDIEARTRGTSVYFPDRVIPMLPETLSNDICSLRPNEDRLAVVCDMHISAEGNLKTFKFVEGVIRSKARLTYTEVADFLKGHVFRQSKEVTQSVSQLHALMKALHIQREKRGALDFESQEAVVNVDRGRPTHAFVVQRTDAHRLIEEAMICANVAAARYLEEQGAQPLYRIHDSPRSEAYESLRELLQPYGIRVSERASSPKELQRLLDELRQKFGGSQMRVWEQAVIRSLQLAQYSPLKTGHFGLALDSYVHFTSPIRRYPDLFIHRLIKNRIRKSTKIQDDKQSLTQLGADLSESEQRANAATRKVEGWLKCLLLKDHEGEQLMGMVSSITSFGMFVELDDFWVSGLVHVSDLPYDYYDMIGVTLVGRRSGFTFRVGDRYKVAVDSVIPDLGHVNLRLVGGQV